MPLFDSYLNQQGRKQSAGRTLLIIFLLIVGGLVLFYFGARRFERSVVFHPERYSEGPQWKLPRGGEDIWFKGAGGERLHGWYVRASGPEAASRATVIYFHGNGGNISNIGWLGEALSARGFNVLLFDYRGYGRSEGSVRDERAIYEDAGAAYNYVVVERRVPPEQVVLYGQSLGTTAAADLASRQPCGAVILESGLSSASDMARLILPWVPTWIHRYGQNRFESARKLERVSAPVFVAHGGRDETIPVEQGYKLYNAAREPKRLLIIEEAGHNDLIGRGGKEYLNALAEFIKSHVKVE
ncbi:MAG TPA: alpha/beta hydrolase [Pyrinomonadaceae bacterium]|nr:alpha/beta hydrolase [Pyrinomonadaceae bacterium]